MRLLHGCAFAVALCLMVPAVGIAQDPSPPPVPEYFVVSPQAQLKPNFTYELYGEAELAVPGAASKPVQRGKHWTAGLTIPGAPDGSDPDDLWVHQVKPTLANAGWTFLAEIRGQAKIGHYQKDGHDAWMMLWAVASDDMRLDLVEVGPCPIHMDIPRPPDKRESISAESGDFPYLPPMPGSTSSGGHHDDAPMIVNVELDKDHSEDQVVGLGTTIKSYNAPPFQSPILFLTVYSEALTKAGWKLSHLSHSADAALTAHYATGGRNLWAYVHGGGSDYTLTVADEGDLAAQLEHDCHVALYGLEFDFNKSTLRPDSEPVLENVLSMLSARSDLKVEVQGHTDNVGSDEYNQKLSEARAAAVMSWLTAKGVAADRLTAHGYGMRQPIADNGSDEGRARNRRVELKKQGCSGQ